MANGNALGGEKKTKTGAKAGAKKPAPAKAGAAKKKAQAQGKKKLTKKQREKLRKRRRIKRAVYMGVYLLLICLLDYPYVSRIYNGFIQGSVVSGYSDAVAESSGLDEARAAAVAYNERLFHGGAKVEDAFKEKEGAESEAQEGLGEYRRLLNIAGNGVMGTLNIPCIDVELPIYHGTDEADALQKGIGHLEGTSLPVGGENTHAVLSGHSGLKGKTMLTNLDRVEEGDVFFINVLGEALAYKVYGIEIVLPSDVSPLKIQAGKDLCTLVTCTPYGINSHRLLVHGERVEWDEGNEVPVSQAKNEVLLKEWWWLLATILFLVMMLVTVKRIR